MGDVDIVLDSPRVGHEHVPDLAQARDNNRLDTYDSAAQPQHHDVSQNVSVVGTVSSHSAPDVSRASAEPSLGIGLQSQIKDENGQLGGNLGTDERATTAHDESRSYWQNASHSSPTDAVSNPFLTYYSCSSSPSASASPSPSD